MFLYNCIRFYSKKSYSNIGRWNIINRDSTIRNCNEKMDNCLSMKWEDYSFTHNGKFDIKSDRDHYQLKINRYKNITKITKNVSQTDINNDLNDIVMRASMII